MSGVREVDHHPTWVTRSRGDREDVHPHRFQAGETLPLILRNQAVGIGDSAVCERLHLIRVVPVGGLHLVRGFLHLAGPLLGTKHPPVMPQRRGGDLGAAPVAVPPGVHRNQVLTSHRQADLFLGLYDRGVSVGVLGVFITHVPGYGGDPYRGFGAGDHQHAIVLIKNQHSYGQSVAYVGHENLLVVGVDPGGPRKTPPAGSWWGRAPQGVTSSSWCSCRPSWEC